jgi:hypothetical protein
MSPICPEAGPEWGSGDEAPPSPSRHVFRVERKHGPQWSAKYRLPDWLRGVLDEARRGTFPAWSRPASPSLTPPTSGSATSSTTATASPRRSSATRRSCAPPPPRLRPRADRVDHHGDDRDVDGGHRPGARHATRALVLLHGIFKRAEGLRFPTNPPAQSSDRRRGRAETSRSSLWTG